MNKDDNIKATNHFAWHRHILDAGQSPTGSKSARAPKNSALYTIESMYFILQKKVGKVGVYA